MNKLLGEGDIITLKAGMTVFGKIPERFVASNKSLSKQWVRSDIRVGNEYKETGDISKNKKTLLKTIKNDFLFHLGIDPEYRPIEIFIESLTNIQDLPKSFILEPGDFVVTQTKHDGGGTAMFHDTYPDGHHVFCKRLKDGKYDPDGVEVDFYQTGCFTTMILASEISPKGRLEKTYQ